VVLGMRLNVICSIGIGFVLQSRLVDWDFVMLLSLIKPYWGSECGDILKNTMFCGDR
jgi:hypothetical protein